MDAWNTIVSFWGAKGLFSGAIYIYVSFRECHSAWWKFEDVSSEALFFPLRSEGLRSGTLPKTSHDTGKSTMNEDVSAIEHGDFPACHVSFQGCNS